MKKFIIFALMLAACLSLCACGAGSAETVPTTVHEHDFVQGTCSGCGEAQDGYKALTAYSWETAGIIASGMELDVINLWFGGEEAAISASYYQPLEEWDQGTQDYYLQEETESLYEWNGQKFAPKGFGDERPMQAEEQGNTVVVSVMEDSVIGTITMVRTAADQYTVTEVTGRIIDATVTECLKVGNVFTAKG